MRKYFTIALAVLALSAPVAAFAKGGGGGGIDKNPTTEKMKLAAADAACKQNMIYCNGSDGPKYWGKAFGTIVPAAYQ